MSEKKSIVREDPKVLLLNATWPIHKFALLFPEMTPEEFAALKADIAENGVREPIVLFQGKVLEGRHRHRACAELGIEVPCRQHEGDEKAALALVVSANLVRRHLTTDQRKELAAKYLKADPNKSNRAVAAACGVSDKTAAKVRKELESGGQIDHLDTRKGRDGKTYRRTEAGAEIPHLPSPLAAARAQFDAIIGGAENLHERIQEILSGPAGPLLKKLTVNGGQTPVFQLVTVERQDKGTRERQEWNCISTAHLANALRQCRPVAPCAACSGRGDESPGNPCRLCRGFKFRPANPALIHGDEQKQIPAFELLDDVTLDDADALAKLAV